ncbi:MAG: YceD family protein [Bacillus subtilis]|nr:YceD family protein [Bacillus subtilis]
MKWTIHELKKRGRTDPTFDYVADLKSYLSELVPDVLDIGPVHIHGSYRIQEHDQEYWFDVFVETVLTMPCAITLEEVEVPLRFQTELMFARTLVDDQTQLIEGITIDLDPIIWSEIVVEKPMKVVKEGASLDDIHQNPEIEDADEDSQNPFSELKNN